MTVQSRSKMFELCATTRMMCLRHPTPIVHVWDVARRSRFSACDSCSELPCVVLCRSTVIYSDKQNWRKAPRLVTPTRQKHQTDSLPLPFRPRPRYRRRQGPSRSSRPPRSACQPPAFSYVPQGQTRKCAWPFWLPSLSTFRHALQKGAAFAGSATGAP